MGARANRRWGPSLRTSWGLVGWLLVPLCFVLQAGPVREADLPWHLLMGRDILENGRFAGDPSWTYGPHVPWVTTQAGSEVALHLVHVLWSWPGIALMRMIGTAALVVSLLVATTWWLARMPVVRAARASVIVSVCVLVGVWPAIQERPQLLSFVLLPWVGVLVIGVMYADRWPAWWWVGPVVLGWSWFHGAAVLVAPMLLLAATVRALAIGGRRFVPVLWRSLRRGWPVLLVAAVAPLLSPPGLQYYRQVDAIRASASTVIIEWAPVTREPVYLLLILPLAAVWVVAVVTLLRRASSPRATLRMDALLGLVFVALGLVAARYLPILLLLVAPLVARRLAQAWSRPDERWERLPRSLGVTVLAVASLTAAVLAATSLPGTGIQGPSRIWAGISAAGSAGERRVLVDYDLGGQVMLLGEATASIDGRADRYGEATILEHARLLSGAPGWESLLARYPGTTDIVTSQGLGPVVEAAGWRRVCDDAGVAWLVAPGVRGDCPPPASG